MLPNGFVYFKDPRVILCMAYASPDNFTGRVVEGYEAAVCIMTTQAAHALTALQDKLDQEHPGIRLKIFDAYRPHRAVVDFQTWAQEPDEKMKSQYYPDLTKPELFSKGYISKNSAHSRGSTIDLTLTRPQGSGLDQELDMGTPFDFFHEHSHTANPAISDRAKENRTLLKTMMEEEGFENYRYEWWHYTLKNEPFPETHFDFPIR